MAADACGQCLNGRREMGWLSCRSRSRPISLLRIGRFRVPCSPMSVSSTPAPPIAFKTGNETLIKVLDGAAARLRSLLKRQGRLDSGALRVAVVGGGCSGLQYKMDLVDGPANRDILVPSNGVRVVIDPKSALFVT